jgi:hypothetical protein
VTASGQGLAQCVVVPGGVGLGIDDENPHRGRG